MIINMIILLILLGCWLNGHKRGLIALVISTITYFIGWVIARLGAKSLGMILSSILPSIGNQGSVTTNRTVFSQMVAVDSNQFFYNGIAFIIIFYGITFLSRWLLKRINFIKKVPVLGTVNGWAGGLIDVILGYLIIFMVLMIFQMWPASWWQDQLANSGLAQWMIMRTPILAENALHWFM
ncbi:CvpA family protein [uncultured Limosilactobacillus sp.]|uniref:CvpA family protein n=1 Tax=uncultured Limosilactobacillus sp. TaxID=2837629 RepID=UPI0025E76D1C|nr:CvpA family protein [uncultured Limosilactobacillus sp.]